MPYCINIGELSNTFTVPSRVADKLIKLSGAVQLKVLLVALNTNPANIVPENIAEKLSISVPDVTDALNYWVENGILTNGESTQKIVEAKKATPKKVVAKAPADKPSREQVIKRGNEAPEIAFLLREAQLKLGRPLRPNESSTLLWLYDDEGFTVSIILLLISFAVNEGKPTIGFIERTALNWINKGIHTVDAAEKEITKHNAKKSAWNKITSAMGLDKRMPSTKEAELAYKWVEDYGYDTDMLRLAYEACVDSTNKFSMQYINKIIENWHKNGVKTAKDVEEINSSNKKADSNKKDSFNLDSYQKMLETLPE